MVALRARTMDEQSRKPIWDEARLSAVHDQPDKSRRVRRMFDAIAPSYETVNSIFSLGRDRVWRTEAVRLARVKPGDMILDVACGTGDLLRSFQRLAPMAQTYCGVDFSSGMLALAVDRSPPDLLFCLADGMQLPFADGTFDVVSCAFGVRNFDDLDRGLAEMHRVLRTGGRAVILEFTRPSNGFVRRLYEFYAMRLMPVGARLVSGDRTGAYSYLPRSVVSFLSPENVCQQLRQVGFASVEMTQLTLGVVTVYVAGKDMS